MELLIDFHTVLFNHVEETNTTEQDGSNIKTSHKLSVQCNLTDQFLNIYICPA